MCLLFSSTKFSNAGLDFMAMKLGGFTWVKSNFTGINFQHNRCLVFSIKLNRILSHPYTVIFDFLESLIGLFVVGDNPLGCLGLKVSYSSSTNTIFVVVLSYNTSSDWNLMLQHIKKFFPFAVIKVCSSEETKDFQLVLGQLIYCFDVWSLVAIFKTKLFVEIESKKLVGSLVCFSPKKDVIFPISLAMKKELFLLCSKYCIRFKHKKPVSFMVGGYEAPGIFFSGESAVNYRFFSNEAFLKKFCEFAFKYDYDMSIHNVGDGSEQVARTLSFFYKGGFFVYHSIFKK